MKVARYETPRARAHQRNVRKYGPDSSTWFDQMIDEIGDEMTAAAREIRSTVLGILTQEAA